MQRGHSHGEERDEQHDDAARAALGEERGARQQDDQNEDRREVAGACLKRARLRVECVLREVKRQEQDREQRRAHEHVFVCHGAEGNARPAPVRVVRCTWPRLATRDARVTAAR